MATLSQAQRIRMAGYRGPEREGFTIPNTDHGLIYQNACWNFVLGAGQNSTEDALSDMSIRNAFVATNLEQIRRIGGALQATGVVNGVDLAIFGGGDSEADYQLLKDNFATANGAPVGNPFTANQSNFLGALVRIMLRANGYTVADPGVDWNTLRLSIHVKSSSWYNTDHWAVGTKLRDTHRRTYVQTIPSTTVRHACETVWDEGLPGVNIGILEMPRENIDIIDRIQPATAQDAGTCWLCGVRHGWLPSVFYKWDLCRTCGNVICPNHRQSHGANCINCGAANTTF